jgi:hypothetical protein
MVNTHIPTPGKVLLVIAVLGLLGALIALGVYLAS